MNNLLNNLLKLLGLNDDEPKPDTLDGNMIWSPKHRRMIHFNRDGSVNH